MAKDFKSKIGNKRLNSLIPSEEPAEAAIRQQNIPQRKVEKPDESTVATFRVNTNKLLQLKAIAFWDRKKIQDVLDEALEAYIGSIPSTSLKKATEEYTKRVS